MKITKNLPLSICIMLILILGEFGGKNDYGLVEVQKGSLLELGLTNDEIEDLQTVEIDDIILIDIEFGEPMERVKGV
ncbi:hypothetical protein HB911_08005 [Listeria booriae]|uniref:hypothetical protein n=1 Tax=Listeria booriae TaxID=1552123 RepID=UPI001624FAE9|nr:hypothetical protein [Listeria booriae]MBC1558639.1 hypothetical protein [Listeria booriae]